MSYNLFLDDLRRPEDCTYMEHPIYDSVEWIIVRNYYAFISIIEKKGMPEVITFDHDLADVHYKKKEFDYYDNELEKTGYHCAKWLINYCMDNELDLPETVMIHSMNPVGAVNIKSLFDTYCKVWGKEINPIVLIPHFMRKYKFNK